MSVTLTGTGGLASRIGKFGSEYLRTVSGFGSSLDTGITAVDGQFASNDQIAVDTLYTVRDSYRGVHGSYLSALTNFASNTVIEQVNRDTPLASKTLVNALTELRSQMVTNVTTFQRPTTTLTVTPDASNLGDGVVVGSLTNEFGDPLDYVMAETVKLRVTSDSASGATKYAETITVTGEPVKAVTEYQWPGGSGASGSFNMKSATTDDLIRNADFETFTVTNTPDNWVVGTGAITTNILKEVSSVVRGNSALKLLSDGTTLTKLYQVVTLSPNKVYAVNLWGKMSAADSSGVFRVRLCNSSGTTINNDAGTALSYTRDTNTQIGTAYTQITTFFQTPRQLPTEVRFEIGFTTSPASPKYLLLDLIGFNLSRELYAGGPYLSAFSKTTNNAVGDKFNVAVTNNANPVSFPRMLDRMFSLKANRLYFPSTASSPTVSDTLLQ